MRIFSITGKTLFGRRRDSGLELVLILAVSLAVRGPA